MTDTNTEHRSYFQASGDAVSVRAGEDDGDGQFTIRMPVSSTAEARDGEAFTRDRLRGFAEQIADSDVGVFLDHGRSDLGGSRYSALGKVGYWDSADIVDRDAGADLVADAVLMDPAELSGDVDTLREALATLKAQAELGVPLASSVGWSEDTGERDVPGDADLLEISIVGIPSDPRTTTASAEPAPLARAVSAASSDFDFETFRRELRAHDDTDPMTDDSESADAESADEQRDEQDGMDADDYRSSMLEMQRQQTETLSTLADALRENDDDDDEDEDDDDMEGEKAAAEPDAERTIEIDGEERTVAEVRDELADLRAQAEAAEPEQPATEDRATDDSDDEIAGFGMADRLEDN